MESLSKLKIPQGLVLKSLYSHNFLEAAEIPLSYSVSAIYKACGHSDLLETKEHVQMCVAIFFLQLSHYRSPKTIYIYAIPRGVHSDLRLRVLQQEPTRQG